MSSRLTTLASVLASVVSFATLHCASSNVAFATDPEAATIRAGGCWITQNCPETQPDCMKHCKDDGCELDIDVPFRFIRIAPSAGNKEIQAPCTDEYDCLYFVLDSTQSCTL